MHRAGAMLKLERLVGSVDPLELLVSVGILGMLWAIVITEGLWP
jgi:hypothetical protein